VNSPHSLLERVPRALPLARRSTRRTWLRRLIWLVPAASIVLVACLAWSSVRSRGPTVRITFATAEGLEARKTTIKYKSVNIGVVSGIELLDDRSGVVVTAELSRQAGALLVQDARFWVVRPRVSASGVSGIGTLIAGAHIGFDAGRSRVPARAFVGLEAPPTTVSDRPGSRFTLRAENVGSVDVGSPIYLRRVQVGQVTRVSLDAGGGAVLLEAFVDAPYDRLVTTDTRFWNASGVDVTIDTRGIQLDTQSLASVLAGGIAFQTPAAEAPAAPAPTGTRFDLYPGHEAAMRAPSAGASTYRLIFARPAATVAPGAPVLLSGLEIGHVLRAAVDFDARNGDARTIIDVALHPERVQVRGGGDDRDGFSTTMARLVGRGLRARVRTTNLLTGQRAVVFELCPGARRAAVDWNAHPIELPTADGDSGDVPAALGRLVAKLEKVPLEDLARQGAGTMADMRDTLEKTSGLVARVDTELAPQLGLMMAQARKTLASMETTLSQDAPLQQDLRRTMRDLSDASQAVRGLADELERHPEALIRGKKEDRP
jgi:paraquat-inducible protein B